MKTVFFGASNYVIPLLEFLNKNYDLTLVVTTEQKPTDPVPKYCTEHSISYISITKLDETLRSKLLALGCPFAVLADFRLLVRQDVIDIFPKGIINIHPSLLPEYRGPTPGTSALLDGKTTTGVSLMLLDKDLDHGPVLAQEKVTIALNETSATLYPKLFKKGTELLEKVLPEYLDGKIEPKEQDHSKATYTDYLKRESGFIDLSKTVISSEVERSQDGISPSASLSRNDKIVMSPEKLHNMIRAYFPWPGVWFVMNTKKKALRVKLLPPSCHPELDSGSLPLLQVEGKKPVNYKDFMNGYPEGKELLGKLGLL